MLRYGKILFRGIQMNINYYQIDEVAKSTGITKRTIRYYEEMELLKPMRTEAGYRLYTQSDIEIIKEIKELRIKLGMNFEQIQHFLGLKNSILEILDGDTKDIRQIEETEDKIKELMILVDEKDAVLKRIKNNCNKYLNELEKRTKQPEECQL
ncbi:MerR family transcriptional regulator [Acetobacterium tundrae]|uniref:MerR family transcriptional regulator n=2 Tax=Eubacteriaceae TaxID=186806 RepID=A0ABR6WMH1_9FIRM|nr:MerR family transcriptional regulator [Acetobacterium tundrae]